MPAPTTAGEQVNRLIIKNKLSADEAVRQVLGEITTVLPQGARVISKGLNFIEYQDAEGFTHRITRQGDANSPDFGRISDQTDRPGVLPITQQFPGLENTLNTAIGAVNRGLTGQLATLTEEDRALLESIRTATLQQLNQRFTREGGELVTQLFGKGTNQSTLAGNALADLQQAQGFVQNEALSNLSQLDLGLRQFLTQLSTGAGSDILGLITNQGTQREIAAGQLALGNRTLDQQIADSARQFMLDFEKFQASQRRSPLPGILSGIASLASAIPGIGPAIGAGLSTIGRIAGGGGSGAITGAGSTFPQN